MANKQIHELSTLSNPLYSIADNGSVTGKFALNQIAGLFTVAPSGYSGFADYYCTGSGDESIINGAVTALGASGGTLLLMRGTFICSNPIVVTSNVTIRGTGTGTTVAKIGSGNAISVIGTSGARKSNVLIEDLVISGPSTNAVKVAGDGVQFDYTDNATVRNCLITGFGSAGDDGGVAMRRSTNIKVLDSLLYNNLNGAICGASTATFPDCDGVTVRGCTLSSNWADGTHTQQSKNIRWDNNHSTLNGESGFDVLGSANVTIVNNTSTLNTHSGIEAGNTTSTGSADTSLVITGNVCTDNTLNGIQILGFTDYPLITGNTCKNNTIDGIQLAGNSSKDVRRAMVTDNMLLANSRDGLRITNINSGHVIRNNFMYDNGGRGILLTATSGLVIDDIYISQNKLSGNVTAPVAITGAGTFTNITQLNNPGSTTDTKQSKTMVLYAPGTAAAWTTQPAALTEFRGQAATRIKADITDKTQFRITARITGTAGATGSTVGVQYSTDESTWKWLDDGASPVAGTNAVALTSTNTTQVSSWTSLATSAKADVFLRIAGQGGDGTISPTLGNISVEFA